MNSILVNSCDMFYCEQLKDAHTCHYHVKSNMQILCKQLGNQCITLGIVTCLWTGLEKCVECIQLFVFMTKVCIHQGAIIHMIFKKEKVVDRRHTSLVHTLLIHIPRKQCAYVTCVLRPCSSEHRLVRLEATTRAKHWTPHGEGPEKTSNTSCRTMDAMIITYSITSVVTAVWRHSYLHFPYKQRTQLITFCVVMDIILFYISTIPNMHINMYHYW